MLPHDADAERAVLGCLMLSPSPADEAEAFATLDAGTFFVPAHGAIFEALRDCRTVGAALEEVAIASQLRSRGQLEQAGGIVAISRLVEATSTGANLAHYTRTVREMAQRRQLIAVAQQAIVTASDLEFGLREAVDRVAESVSGVVTSGGRMAPKSMAQLVCEEFARLRVAAEAPIEDLGVPTGFYALDEMILGMRAGELVYLAGRPSMGKSALALAIARNAAVREQIPVLVFSLEMKDSALVRRELAALSQVDSRHLRRPKKLEGDEWSRLATAAGKLDTRLLQVIDRGRLSVLDIRAEARVMKARHGLGLIVVDYLQLVRPAHPSASRERDVAEMSADLKALGGELEIPCLVLSQLNRALETRQNKRPILADLRESGALEQDGDVIIAVHRPGAYDDKQRDDFAEAIVLKQRDGPTGIVEVGWDAKCVRFFNREMFRNEQ
jgi:replicative DNA helicase